MQRVYIFFPRFRLMRIQVVRGFTKTFYRKTLKILNKGSFILKQVETTYTFGKFSFLPVRIKLWTIINICAHSLKVPF